MAKQIRLGGGRADFTGVLRGFPFVRGVFSIPENVSPLDLDRLERVFRYDEGKLEEVPDAAPKAALRGAVPGGAKAGTAPGTGDAGAASGALGGDAGPGSGSAGGNPGAPEGGGAGGAELTREQKIKAALLKLDPAEGSHWNQNKEPRVDAVERFFGEKLTRAEVSEVAAGFNRDAAAELSGLTD